jgi:hypothetical protein
MRWLAISAQNHESALGRYPTASDGTTDLLRAQTAGGNGDAPATSHDGFSWLYQILPYVEEEMLYYEMKQEREMEFVQTGPFDADFIAADRRHYASFQISSYRCPTFSGDQTTTMGGVEAATANYCALVGTDLTDREEAFWKVTPNWENGGLPSACWNTPASQSAGLAAGSCVERGLRLRNIDDGISKTMIAAESRERLINAWISGASMWVVAASPNSLAYDGVRVGRARKQDNFVAMMQGDESVEEDGLGLALNFGRGAASPPADETYLKAVDWATRRHRAWGPSSEHSGYVVIHAFADGHTRAVSIEVNPTIYLRFITRNEGDEPTDDGMCDG